MQGSTNTHSQLAHRAAWTCSLPHPEWRTAGDAGVRAGQHAPAVPLARLVCPLVQGASQAAAAAVPGCNICCPGAHIPAQEVLLEQATARALEDMGGQSAVPLLGFGGHNSGLAVLPGDPGAGTMATEPRSCCTTFQACRWLPASQAAGLRCTHGGAPQWQCRRHAPGNAAPDAAGLVVRAQAAAQAALVGADVGAAVPGLVHAPAVRLACCKLHPRAAISSRALQPPARVL